MNFKCKCGGETKEGQTHYQCPVCETQVKKDFYGCKRSDDVFKRLFAGETLNLPASWEERFSSNKDFKIDFEAKKIVTVGTPPPKSEAPFQCKCSGSVSNYTRFYRCDLCDVTVWKNFGGFTRDEKDIAKLFAGQKVFLPSVYFGYPVQDRTFILNFAKNRVYYIRDQGEEAPAPKTDSGNPL